ncbi:MAG: hypothetical protein K9L88_13190 [Chromatiaceae bacterium]|nr:hypothetical protein [Chromatiaceae bacterium]
MAEEVTKHRGKCLIQWLRNAHLDEYGSVILGVDVRKIIGIEYPEVGTRAEFDSLSLAELAAVDYARNILLGEGKYLTQQSGDYRILLPSENARQIQLYMQHADKKLKRALKLSRNSPLLDTHKQDNTSARILMKREAIKSRRIFGDAG